MATRLVPKETTDFSGAAVVGLTALSIGSSIYDQKKQSKATMAQMGREREAFLYTQDMTIQEVEEVDRQLSLVLSSNEIEELKNESKLKAMSVASGLTGTITKDQVSQASAVKREADVQVVSQARSQQTKLLSSMVESEISYRNKLGALTSGLPDAKSAGLRTLSAGVSGFRSGLGLLTPKQQENFFA